jgi:hypothetical protein
MVDINKAKNDPASEFKSPKAILKEDSISRIDKIDILRRWAYDAREIAVAEEENMQSANDKHHVLLEEIQKCLLKLGKTDDEHSPTKQGG